MAVPSLARATPQLSATLQLVSDWGSGYVASVVVTNTGSSPTDDWAVAVEMGDSALVGAPWRAEAESVGTEVVFTPEDYAAVIPPGGQESFGFQGQASGPQYQPVVSGVTCGEEPEVSHDQLGGNRTVCVTGAPLSQSGWTDPVVSAVVSAVCAVPGFEACCSERWSLRCVQKGAVFARQNGLGGQDFCGRYAWDQVVVPGTQQHFPRDFNLVALSGPVRELRDIEGAIAANGPVNIRYFNLNYGKKEEIALLGTADVTLSAGTVHGQLLYGGLLRDTQDVTYTDAARPTAPTSPAPVDFAAVTADLTAMSQSLAGYPAQAPSQIWPTVRFTATDPELNVFAVAASDLANATSYVIDVPLDSSLIINVTGTNPVIQNTGISGAFRQRKLLWNFPEATTLHLNSVGLPGSVLAPLASADLRNGSIGGTVVVAAAPWANVELYHHPFQVPSCGGGLCLDPTWSCSADTDISDDGHALDIRHEAGFLEIAGGPYVAEGVERTSPDHRVWYAFQPAKAYPKTKPLVVFVNGGPGAATTSLLFSFNTATKTFIVNEEGTSATLVHNPHSWTEFANLLYIDAPATGFSYPLYPIGGENDPRPDIGTDEDRDSGMFLRTILRFLARHPSLQANPIMLVAESYSGVRANFMLYHLLNYESLDTEPAYQDLLVSEELDTYFQAVFGTVTPTTEQIVSKFSHQVLIDAVVGGRKQYDQGFNMFPGTGCMRRDEPCNGVEVPCYVAIPAQCTDPETGETRNVQYNVVCDLHNCDKPLDWSLFQEHAAATALTDVNVLSSALGVNARTIRWMHSEERARAYGRAIDADLDVVRNPVNLANHDVFGPLNSEDSYLVLYNEPVNAPYSGASRWADDGDPAPDQSPKYGYRFAFNVLSGVRSFLTVAQFDYGLHTPAVPWALQQFLEQDAAFQSLVSDVQYYPTLDILSELWGIARPGYFAITPATGPSHGIIVAMPHSYQSGHTVPMRAPAEFLADVRNWYQNTTD